jgi:hypothetical protein
MASADEIRYSIRANCAYQEFCTLSGRANETIEFFDYKGFRYVEVLNWPGELSAEGPWVNERLYPFLETSTRFDSSEELLKRIWMLCRNGVKKGTQDTTSTADPRKRRLPGRRLHHGGVPPLPHRRREDIQKFLSTSRIR